MTHWKHLSLYTYEQDPNGGGYWHGLSGLQNRPKLWRWDGQIDIILNWSSVRLNIPARIAINSLSLKFDLERWQFDSWPLISSLQSNKQLISRNPRLAPQEIPPTPTNEHLFSIIKTRLVSFSIYKRYFFALIFCQTKQVWKLQSHWYYLRSKFKKYSNNYF